MLLVSLLAGCESVYNSTVPEGMTLVEVHYSDWPALAAVCGGDAEACAIVDGDVCTIHLPVAGNGDPMHRDHEIRHCSGQIDAPKPVERYFND